MVAIPRWVADARPREGRHPRPQDFARPAERIWLTANLLVADTCIRHADVYGTRLLMWACIGDWDPG